MEQEKLKQFTFYELYADILNGLNDVEAGKFANRICGYEFENAEPTDAMTDKENFYWSNILDTLAEVKEIERREKIPKKYNLRAKHFTFYDTYFNAMKLLNDRQCGMFVKAICEYMFGGVTPNFNDKTMQGYFNLCKRKMDISKQRKSVGTSGGNAKKKPKKETEAEEIPTEIMTYKEFRQQYQEIQGELYGSAEQYKTALDWADVAVKLETDMDLQNEANIYRLTQKYVQRYGEKR
ncbi:MAG: hypothetical protein K2G96_01010 [Clostridia bacterium]|nr:hypothetical protein [Clostridia bacterium]